jgi:hypothetical protein
LLLTFLVCCSESVIAFWMSRSCFSCNSLAIWIRLSSTFRPSAALTSPKSVPNSPDSLRPSALRTFLQKTHYSFIIGGVTRRRCLFRKKIEIFRNFIFSKFFEKFEKNYYYFLKNCNLLKKILANMNSFS